MTGYFCESKAEWKFDISSCTVASSALCEEDRYRDECLKSVGKFPQLGCGKP